MGLSNIMADFFREKLFRIRKEDVYDPIYDDAKPIKSHAPESKVENSDDEYHKFLIYWDKKMYHLEKNNERS
jgi:hypothetical protein